MTPDPVMAVARKNPLTWNQYSYMNGDPVNNTDSTGQFTDDGIRNIDFCIATWEFITHADAGRSPA